MRCKKKCKNIRHLTLPPSDESSARIPHAERTYIFFRVLYSVGLLTANAPHVPEDYPTTSLTGTVE